MQRLEVSGAVRPIYGSLGFKRLTNLMHKIFFYNVYYTPVHVSSTRCSSSGGQNCIIQHLDYHHTCRWPSGAQVRSQPVHRTATCMCDDTRCCIIEFWPPDDEHIVFETCITCKHNIKMNLKGKWPGRGLDSSGSRQGQVAGSCWYGSEPVDTKNAGYLLTSWGTTSFSRRTLLHWVS